LFDFQNVSKLLIFDEYVGLLHHSFAFSKHSNYAFEISNVSKKSLVWILR